MPIDILRETTKAEFDSSLLDLLKKYSEKAKEISGPERDFASVYDVLDPPATARAAK